MVARGGARWGIASERRRGVLGLVTSLAVGVLVATVEAQPGVLTREQVTVILASTRDLSGKTLAGLDLSKLNLARTNLRRANLGGANLEGADLWRADLGGADLVRARLAGTNLTGADLSEADLTGADLSQAVLVGAKLRKSKLAGGTRLTGADLGKADLSGSELREAHLQRASLIEATLTLADLRGADLTEAKLEGADLTRALLAGANLTRASLRRARLARADFEGADIAGADFVGADHGSARNLERAVNFHQAKWQDAAPTPGAEARPAAPQGSVTARIHLRNGAVIEVESWTEQEEVVFYTQGGVTYGVPRIDIARMEDAQGRPIALKAPPKGSDDIFKCKAPKLGDDEGMLQEFFRCTGAKPSFRTRIRAGRELTVYSVPSRSAGSRHDHYWVRNGQVVEIETTGTR